MRQASIRQRSPRQLRLWRSDSFSDWKLLSIVSLTDLRIAGPITGCRMSTRIRGSLRIEVSVAGTDEWRPIYPKDGVFDQADEAFDANLAGFVPAGPQLLAVRAYDTAGNSVTRDVEAK